MMFILTANARDRDCEEKVPSGITLAFTAIESNTKRDHETAG
ncbi:MAG: hypothetical protein CM15mP12_1000 [Gammaproteobacteria bacterium]|nr:MAG: hypothetical protein CM15mP12_1000 [Gammaproteobacteria bacterium]